MLHHFTFINLYQTFPLLKVGSSKKVSLVVDWKKNRKLNVQLFCLQKQKPVTDHEKIHDEVKRQGSKCTCVKQFRIHKIGEGKYRVKYNLFFV